MEIGQPEYLTSEPQKAEITFRLIIRSAKVRSRYLGLVTKKRNGSIGAVIESLSKYCPLNKIADLGGW